MWLFLNELTLVIVVCVFSFSFIWYTVSLYRQLYRPIHARLLLEF